MARYVKELTAALVKTEEKQDFPSIIERVLARARADAALLADGDRLDHIGCCVDYVFRTSRGLIAQFKDGRALAQSADGFKLFNSLADYRQAHQDQGVWEELTALNHKRRFFAQARASLEQINASSRLPGAPAARASGARGSIPDG